MAFTKTVHHRDPKNPSRLLKVTPYVLFRKQGELPLFLQDGRFYYEDGKHVNDPPEWALEQAEGLSDKTKERVKWEGTPKKRGRPPKEKVNGDNQSDGSVDS